MFIINRVKVHKIHRNEGIQINYLSGKKTLPITQSTGHYSLTGQEIAIKCRSLNATPSGRK